MVLTNLQGTMSVPLVLLTFVLTFFVSNVRCLGATDTITWGGDNSRAGYQTNHNMDPSIVGSSQFGQIFKTLLPGLYNGANEQVFSQPLVYTTPSDGIQYVFVATTQNNIYKLNAKTGAIVLSRNLHIPFLTADLNGCVDINPLVGVTATGVIDPDTDTWYLTSKTYLNQTGGNGAQGKPNGRYYLHAINVNSFNEQPNFPVNLEGTVARNNPIRSFNGGIHHQRPALLHSGQYIYAGFASHCVQYNFTGWIMGWDKTTGVNVERLATEGAGVPNTTPGGGVWMSGGGITSDDAGSLWFATGNGFASQLSTIPVNGRNPPTSLEEAAVHMTINSDGSLTIVDFFMPWEKTQLDGADRDLGTTPLELLPSQFSCGDYKRIGVITGKSGKTYWLNMDDLGGYQNGPNKLDDVIQVYQNENSVYAGAGVYPLEGGYIYINVIQYPTHVFKFTCANGVPSFAKVADSPANNAYVLGVGHGTTTSLNGQTGTGLLWTSDVQGSNLRIYNAVPQNGLLTMINSFNVPGTTKFTRPVFGNGRVYMGTTVGYFYGFGSPVNLPINCTGPVNFGNANLNNATAPVSITCKANIAVTVTSFVLNGDPNFNITGKPSLPLTVAAGSTFGISAFFNPKAVGPLSTDILVNTTNGVAGYSTSTPITLRGNGQSVAALLAVSPVTVAFQGVITGQNIGGVNQTVLFMNNGNSDLTISAINYSNTSETGPYGADTASTSGPNVGPFTFIGVPSVIPANSVITVTINFNPTSNGNFPAYAQVVSNGGTKIFDVVGTSGSAPSAILEFQTPHGTGWVRYQSGTNFTFGNVTENTTRSLKMRLTNNATTNSASLSLTVSKPPFGVAGIIGASNQVDLAEGTLLAPGQNATATLYCSVPKTQINTDPYVGSAQWTMNLDDPTFGKQYIQFACGAIAEQAPPLVTISGTWNNQPLQLQGVYRYAGCFKENNPGRQLKTQLYSQAANTNEMCIAACAKAGLTYCGTQYNSECWGGPTIPTLQVDGGNCNYPCAGNINEICGGNGVGSGAGGSYISLFAINGSASVVPSGTSTTTSGSAPTIAPGGPYVNPGVLGYVSKGCYTEATTGRALANQVTYTPKTVANCLIACGGTTYAGLEYGGECWCGNSLAASSSPTASTDCSMTCSGNSTEYCGAGQRLNMYQLNGTFPATSSTTNSTSAQTGTGTSTASSSASTQTSPAIKPIVNSNWGYIGCYTEATTGRALSSRTYAADTMTLESCATFCAAYSMFGVEYGRECYCGNSLNAGSIKATNQADCNFLCPGNKFEYCGASVRLELYSILGASPTSTNSTFQSSSISSSTSTTTPSSSSLLSSSSLSSAPTITPGTGSSISSSLLSTTTSQSSASPSQSGPAIKQIVSGTWNFTGCWTEATTGRALTSNTFAADNMTLESCAAFCQGYAMFGAEYGRECYCGNTLSAGSIKATNQADCNFLCPGNSLEYCGASLRLELYSAIGFVTPISTTSPVKAGPTQPATIGGSWSFYQCMTEATNSRALTGATFTYDSMTLESCAGNCSVGGFSYFGTEYARECYCGNSFAAGSVIAPATDCNMVCKGNTSEYCGQGNRLSVYKFNNNKATTLIPSSSLGSSSSGSSTQISSIQVSSGSSKSSSSSSSSITSSFNALSSTSDSLTISSLIASSSSSTSSVSTTASSSLSSTTSHTLSISTTSSLISSSSITSSSRPSSLSLVPSSSTTPSSTTPSSTTPSSITSSSKFSSSSSSKSSSTIFTSSISSVAATYTGPPVISQGNVNFTYYNCTTDGPGPRALSKLVESSNNMTIEKCLGECWEYAYAGVEYARECWCGNAVLNGQTNLTDSPKGGHCSKTCSGNSSEYCGAGNTLTLYYFDVEKALNNSKSHSSPKMKFRN